MKCFNFVDAGSGAPPCSIACTMLANLATSPSKIRIFIIHMIMLSGKTDPWYRKVLEILQFVLSERYCCSETAPGLYFTLYHACIAYERILPHLQTRYLLYASDALRIAGSLCTVRVTIYPDQNYLLCCINEGWYL